MKNKTVKMLALLMTIVTVLSACGTTDASESSNSSQEASKQESSQSSVQQSEVVEESEYPEYLNLDSAYPVIKDEFAGTVKPTMAICLDNSAKSWDELYTTKYLKQKYNLEFDVEVIPGSSFEERRSLILNSGELPDILFNFYMDPVYLVTYGQEGEMFLKMDEYINETLTPNIWKALQDPVIKAACTAPDGHIYSLPQLVDGTTMANQCDRFFVNVTVIEECYGKVPATLDEFVECMYAVKEKYPDMIPMGGASIDAGMGILQTALGYVLMNDGYGTEVCLNADGEVVIPAYDVEVFGEYLKILKDFYADGIVVDNFFTIERTEFNSISGEGRSVFHHGLPEEFGLALDGEEVWDWAAIVPLTSAYNDTPVAYSPSDVSRVGGVAISADTEYPELCMRYLDLYFNLTDDCSGFLWNVGPLNSEYALDENGQPDGFAHMYFDEETGSIAYEGIPEGFSSWTYALTYGTGLMPQVGNYNTEAASVMKKSIISEGKFVSPEWGATEFAGKYRWEGFTETAMAPYYTKSWPKFMYTSEETSAEIADLKTVLSPYIEEQVALFVTGGRSLDELSDFKAELEQMGIERLLEIYTTEYNKTLQ